ncbi:hypothetical protein N7532_007865 [Penicillium argentinense]|uniref:Uncharacterized protein n=1 Tax=Penicillium argentinense TaxID=1131581 RepID=A0A9W9EWI1_9EURO|nr:uncharacterized protein N7532_007865 [Penicillium argentinense]KAJ5089181.1 hypothetical protein N7532_007865 [Penicillium argentinense]
MEARELLAPALGAVMIRGSEAVPHAASESPAIGEIDRRERGGVGAIFFVMRNAVVVHASIVRDRAPQDGAAENASRWVDDGRADQRPRIVRVAPRAEMRVQLEGGRERREVSRWEGDEGGAETTNTRSQSAGIPVRRDRSGTRA